MIVDGHTNNRVYIPRPTNYQNMYAAQHLLIQIACAWTLITGGGLLRQCAGLRV